MSRGISERGTNQLSLITFIINENRHKLEYFAVISFKSIIEPSFLISCLLILLIKQTQPIRLENLDLTRELTCAIYTFKNHDIFSDFSAFL